MPEVTKRFEGLILQPEDKFEAHIRPRYPVNKCLFIQLIFSNILADTEIVSLWIDRAVA